MQKHITNETITTTARTKPYSATVHINSLQICAIQSGVYVGILGAGALAGLFLTTWPAEYLVAMPVAGLLYPWVREAANAHSLQGRHARMQRNILAIEIAQQENVLRDLNDDGVIDSTDAEIQAERDLALFVVKTANVGESMTRRHWEKRYTWSHQRWQYVIRACKDAGVLSTSTSITGAVRPKRILVANATAALTALHNSGHFVQTQPGDYLPGSGSFVKDPRNSISSDGTAYDGPVTTLPPA